MVGPGSPRRRKADPAPPETPGFVVPIGPSLRRVGLEGNAARVALDGDRLILTGDRSGRLEIPARQVRSMRIGMYRSRWRPRPTYDTRIWRRGERLALAIAPPALGYGAYGPVMREFAGWVFADGGVVIRGYGLFGLIAQALIVTGGFSLITLALLGEALASGGVGPWIGAFVCAGLTLLLSKALILGQWPRRVTRPEQLDEFLPAREDAR